MFGAEPKLVECTGLAGLYVNLSHCWGGQQPLVTTRENYEQHLREIPYDSLPRTFQDAVTVTRVLGYRYIWIDSLCIIQDSDDDWQVECAMMEQIYENCAITIAGPNAGSPHAGFLHERPLSSVAPCVVPDSDCDMALKNDLVIGIPVVPHFEGASVNDWNTVSLKGPNSVLDSRAWTIQERLLSPRVIFFGAHQIYYECRTTVCFECCWYPVEIEAAFGVDGEHPAKRARYKRYNMHERSEGEEVWQNWRKVVEFYSGCRLSRPSDKLPALGGLVRRFSKEFSTQYLAGLWRDSLFRDLTWTRRPDRGPASCYDRHYVAPSWSWASVAGPIEFLAYSESEESQLTCLEAQVQHTGADQFNRVSAGRIVLFGHVRELAVRSDADSSCYGLFDPDLQPSDGSIGLCYLDALPARVLEKSIIQLFLLVCDHHSGMWWALAIKRLPNSPDIYCRVGVAQGKVSWTDENPQMWKWQACEMQRITII